MQTPTPQQKVRDNGGYLLDVRDLRTYFFTGPHRTVKAVDGVSFTLEKGECLGVVGESGSGKSVTSRSIMRMVDRPGRIVGGNIFFKGNDLLRLSERQMRAIRGREIAIVFQDPTTSLNPLFKIGHQLFDTLVAHQKLSKTDAKERVIQVLKTVGITGAERAYDKYPCDFSAGFRQRIMIAAAIMCSPDLIIADEPTTTLGVTVQAQILDSLRQIQRQFGTALIVITHDFGVVSQMADRIFVMYAGRCVEHATKKAVLTNPVHPYTVGLIRSVPIIEARRGNRLLQIPGFPPDMTNLPPGCAFALRCDRAQQVCSEEVPQLRPVGEGHFAACYFPYEHADLGLAEEELTRGIR